MENQNQMTKSDVLLEHLYSGNNVQFSTEAQIFPIGVNIY